MLWAHTRLGIPSCHTASVLLQHRATRTLRHLGAGHLKPGKCCFQGESKAQADLVVVLQCNLLHARIACAIKSALTKWDAAGPERQKFVAGAGIRKRAARLKTTSSATLPAGRPEDAENPIMIELEATPAGVYACSGLLADMLSVLS